MKYLIYNDISYLLRKKRFILLILIIVPLIILFLSVNNSTMMYTINRCMGTDLNIRSIDIIQLLSYLFHIAGFIYLIVDIYLKDLTENLENIFLRMQPKKYIIRKNIFFVITTIIIKIVQYLMVTTLFMIISKQSFDVKIIPLAITDITYILLLQYLFLCSYLLSILLRKNVIFLSTTIVILITLVPKCIWGLQPYVIYMIAITILIQIMIYAIFYKYPKKILENV